MTQQHIGNLKLTFSLNSCVLRAHKCSKSHKLPGRVSLPQLRSNIPQTALVAALDTYDFKDCLFTSIELIQAVLADDQYYLDKMRNWFKVSFLRS
jgi:hypothetical protein